MEEIYKSEDRVWSVLVCKLYRSISLVEDERERWLKQKKLNLEAMETLHPTASNT